MKKIVLVLTLAAFALSGSAFAQDPGDMDANNIGIYLTEYAGGNCGWIDANIPFTVYVILTRLTYPEVWGWEAKFDFENITAANWTIYGQHIDAGTRAGERIVGLSEPLMAVNGAVIVAEIQLMITPALGDDPSQPSFVFIEGIYFALVPNGQPAYLEAPGSTGVALWQANAGPETPQLTMNGDCTPVGVESSSWGNLKSLYR